MKHLKFTILLLLLLIGSYIPQISNCYAQNAYKPTPILLSDNVIEYDAIPYVHMLRDPNNNLNVKSVLMAYIKEQNIEKPKHTILKTGTKGQSLWFILELHNRSWNENWTLSFGDTMNGRLGSATEIFLYDHSHSEKILDTTNNQENPYVKKFAPNGTFTNITIPQGQKSLLVMKLKSTGGMPLTLPLKIYNQKYYQDMQNDQMSAHNAYDLILLLIVGILVGAIIYNRIYIAVPIIAYFAIQLMLYNVQNDSFYSASPMAGKIPGIIYNLGIITALITGRYFLQIGKLQQAQLKLLVSAIIVTLISMTISTLFLSAGSTLQLLTLFVPATASLIFLILLSFAQAYSDQKAEYYLFGAAFIFPVAGILITTFSLLSFIPLTAAIITAYWWSLLPCALFLILAITIRSNISIGVNNSAQLHNQDNESDLQNLKKTKEAAEVSRLMKVLQHERQVMNELQDREVKQNEEMRRAKESADEANRAKSAFLAVVSHEIRTPMTGIIGMIRLLQETKLDEKQKNYSQTIKDSGEAMMTLLNDILDFEKIESGNLDIEYIDYDLHRLLNGVVMLMSGHADARKISLSLDMDENVPRYVIGDPVRLRQVLLNLVGNAIKFTEKGSVKLHSHIEKTSKPGQDEKTGKTYYKIHFSVIDTGIGITKEAQEKLFSPFAQAHSAIARKYGGTGLGLAISQKLITAMGGEIKIDSEPGKGSTLFFTLDFEMGQAAAAEETEKNSSLKVALPPADNKLQILIVEDNEINQKLMKELIGRLKHDVQVASNAEDALNILNDNQFNLILMDIELPGMNGKDATQIIRALPDRDKAATPVIALTGNVQDSDITQCFAANMNDHLEKPVDPIRLKAAIESVVNNTLKNPVNLVKRPEDTPTKTKTNETDTPDDHGNFDDIDLDEDSFATALDINNDDEQSLSKEQELLANTDNEAGIDFANLETLRGDMGALQFTTLIESVLQKSEEIIEALKTTRIPTDSDVARRRAHELKGMAGNFSLHKLAEVSGRIEKAGNDGDSTALEQSIAAIPEIYDETKKALNEWLK